MANRHVTRCSTSQINGEMQIKTTMRYHLAPVRLKKKKKSTNNSVREDVGKKEPSYTVDGNINWSSHYRKQYRGCSKNLKIELPYDPAIPLPHIYPRKMKTLI